MVSSGGVECLLGVEPLAVGGGECGVGAGAAFESADAGRDWGCPQVSDGWIDWSGRGVQVGGLVGFELCGGLVADR